MRIQKIFIRIGLIPLVASGLMLATVACGPAPEVTSARVTVTDAGYRVEWTTEPAGRPVDISVAQRPDAARGQATKLADDARQGFFETIGVDRDVRNYFLIDAGGTKPVQAATRVLPLEGGRNFRDLGGYKTEDGRRVRWGRLFRSGSMGGLTPSDFDYLSGVGIRVVCDFRAEHERNEDPTIWEGESPPRFISWDQSDQSETSPLATAMLADDASPDGVRAAMAEIYRLIPYVLADQYRTVLEILAAGEAPLAFHCSAGKDRAGIAAALLLTALGVPRETVIEDYAVSDKVVDYMALIDAADPVRMADSTNAYMMQVPRELLAPVLESDPAYIAATLDMLEANHGSVMAYIHEELGISDEVVQTLRDLYLE